MGLIRMVSPVSGAIITTVDPHAVVRCGRGPLLLSIQSNHVFLCYACTHSLPHPLDLLDVAHMLAPRCYEFVRPLPHAATPSPARTSASKAAAWRS